MMLYSAGLKRSELINLRITFIDSKRMVVLFGNPEVKNTELAKYMQCVYSHVGKQRSAVKHIVFLKKNKI